MNRPSSILVTKLHIPPLRSGLVHRSRLTERLQHHISSEKKLILVSAPAGFGKTTLVSEWLHDLLQAEPPPCRVSWLSLDSADNDRDMFLAYFIAALNHGNDAGMEIGRGPRNLLGSPLPVPVETILNQLINEITELTDRRIMVLDDLHLIEAPSVHEVLDILLAKLPPNLHLVLLTREDPHLHLARLRSQGQVTDLRARDLRFTTDEAADFLNRSMGLELSGEDAASLEARTEGWIAGLQLAALSMQGREDTSAFIASFSGSHRLILDYLIEEVLDQQPPEIQDFLLATAVLDRMNGSLCDALTGMENGQSSLEMLDRENLFLVPLDEERRWYRYHHLFADLLRARLQQTRPGRIPSLQIRASLWYEENGYVNQAIEHALLAQDFKRAVALIEDIAEEVWERGEFRTMGRWLEALPENLLLSKPQLSIFHASSMFISGRLGEAEKRLQDVESMLRLVNRTSDGSASVESTGPDLSAEQRKYIGRIAATRAGMAFYQGDIDGLSRHAEEALAHLPVDDLAWRGSAVSGLADAQEFIGDMNAAYRTRLDAVKISRAAGNQFQVTLSRLKLAIVLRQQGKLQQVLELCAEEMRDAGEKGISHPVALGLLHAIWGEVLAEVNELDEALHKVNRGLELSEQGGDIAGIGWSIFSLVRVLFSRGDMDGAEKAIQHLDKHAAHYEIPPWITSLLQGWRVRIWLARGDSEKALLWHERLDLSELEQRNHLNELEYSALIRVLIFQRRFDEALRFLADRLIQVTEKGRTGRMLELLILKCFVFRGQEEQDQALAVLRQALQIGSEGGFFRIFVDEGPPMAALLYEALQRDVDPHIIRPILASFPAPDPASVEPAGKAGELIEPLSEREIEVLQLIAEGLTYQQIASRLYLAPSTVKVHTRNIYGKLGVNNRTQCINKARAIGILSPF